MAKTKEQINRTDLTYSMLRRVIMRADFTPMLDLESMVSDINRQDWFRNKFNNYERRLLQVKDEVKKKGEEDEDVKKQLEGLVVKRFDDCNIAPERNVTLDIASNFVTIDIRCDEAYTKIDSYLDLMTDTVSFIIANDNYVKLERIAIRKTDGNEFENGDQADAVFEYFDQNIEEEGDSFTLRTYTDSFLYAKRRVQVHYNRTLRILSNTPKPFVFVLDIDSFLDRAHIENRRPEREEVWDIFYNKLNETCFELFKRGVKESFLNTILKD